MRGIRYFYSEGIASNSFDAALHLEAVASSGENLSIPVLNSTSDKVLEIVNALGDSTTLQLLLRNSLGELLHEESLSIGGHASRHILLSTYFTSKGGQIELIPSQPQSVYAAVASYQRAASGRLRYADASLMEQARGVILESSYNTYIGQGCRFTISNNTGSATEGRISLTRDDGFTLLSNHRLEFSAYQTIEFDSCAYENLNSYGKLTLEMETAGSLRGMTTRLGPNNSYAVSQNAFVR